MKRCLHTLDKISCLNANNDILCVILQATQKEVRNEEDDRKGTA